MVMKKSSSPGPKKTNAAARKSKGPRSRRVAVTGGSGKAGRFVVRELQERGYDVLNLDWISAGDAGAHFMHVDLTNFGETIDALSGCDALVHLAAIPAPGRRPAEATFRENTCST